MEEERGESELCRGGSKKELTGRIFLILCFHSLLFRFYEITLPSRLSPSVKMCHLAGSVIVREQGVCRE